MLNPHQHAVFKWVTLVKLIRFYTQLIESRKREGKNIRKHSNTYSEAISNAKKHIETNDEDERKKNEENERR